MKDLLAVAVAQLVQVSSWLIQALIAYAGPGFLFLWLAAGQLPARWRFFFPDELPNGISIMLTLLLAAATGMILFVIGMMFFQAFIERFRINESIENAFVNQQAQNFQGSFDFGAWLASLTPELRQQLANMNADQVRNLVSGWTRNMVRQWLHTGISISPSIQVMDTTSVAREVQALVSGVETQLGFSVGLFGGAIVLGVATGTWSIMNCSFGASIAALFGIYLMFRLCIVMYVAWLNTKLNIFVGIGRSRLEGRPR